MNARARHILEIAKAEEELKRCKPKTPHFRDTYKWWLKLKEQLYLYDKLVFKEGKNINEN